MAKSASKSKKREASQSEEGEVIVLSGGLDSATLAYKLKSENRKIRLVYIDYGKNVSTREKASAKYIANELQVPFEIIHVSGLHNLQIGYISDPGQDELDVK